MITHSLSNRLVFILSLLGLLVSGFLLYEYSISGPVYCPVGGGCDIVRSSPYSQFLGISIPILGVAFYVGMAILSVIHTYQFRQILIRRLQLLGTVSGVGFGAYLTYLEAFVIGAFCFWCILSFIISLALLLSIILAFKRTNEDGN